MSREANAPKVELIYAVAENGVIGRDGGMPWRLPSDLKHFKARTMGMPVVMGRKTFESIGRALPGRRCIVVTRRADYQAPGCEIANDIDAALALARSGDPERICVIGGAEIYRQTMDRADRLVVTEVAASPEGDTTMDPIDPGEWREVARGTPDPDPRDSARIAFVTYERRR